MCSQSLKRLHWSQSSQAPPITVIFSADSVTKVTPVLSPSSGLHGAPGPSAALSVEEGFIQGSAHVRMATAVQDVHWLVTKCGNTHTVKVYTVYFILFYLFIADYVSAFFIVSYINVEVKCG